MCGPRQATLPALMCGPQAGGWAGADRAGWGEFGRGYEPLQLALPGCMCSVPSGPHATALSTVPCRYDHVCKLWDARQDRCLLTVDHGAPIESLAFFPSGRHASAPPSPIPRSFLSSPSCMLDVGRCSVPTNSSAGSLLVTAGGTDVCVWHLLHSGQLVQRITAHQKTATSVIVAAMAGEEAHVMSAGLDGHVKVLGSIVLPVGTARQP